LTNKNHPPIFHPQFGSVENECSDATPLALQTVIQPLPGGRSTAANLGWKQGEVTYGSV